MTFNEGTIAAANNEVFEFTRPKINRPNNKEHVKQAKKERRDLVFEEACGKTMSKNQLVIGLVYYFIVILYNRFEFLIDFIQHGLLYPFGG